MMPAVPTMAYRGGQRPGTPSNMFNRPGSTGRLPPMSMPSYTALESRNAGGMPGQIGTFANNPNAAAPTNKPFAGVQSQPAISPYMNLFNSNLSQGGTVSPYELYVKPQVQQQQQIQQNSTDINGLQNQLSPLLVPSQSQGPQLAPIPEYNFNPPGSGNYTGNGQQP
jgi:hypothetical protein